MRVAFCLILAASGVSVEAGDSQVLVFRGTSDASAAVSVGKGRFLLADDENNLLRLYDLEDAGMPLSQFDLTGFLDIDPDHPEADIEGATRVGNRIYWITSHGRNKDGKLRPNRYRFFATDIATADGRFTLTAAGRPCKDLVHELVASNLGRSLKLEEVTGFGEALSKSEREVLAPKEEGLNIEALAASPDGKTLFIGFRNPLLRLPTGKRAIVVPLTNSDRVLEESAEPRFGRAMLWSLGDRGIRAMEYSRRHRAFFIVAGPVDDETDFALYRFSGRPAESPNLVTVIRSDLEDFKPETLICSTEDDSLLLLSDDGAIDVKVAGPHECIDEDEYDEDDGTCEQKYLADPTQKTFRALVFAPK